MSMLNLTIDLPKSSYSITDKPTGIEQAANTLMTVFSTILLFIAMVGVATIWTVNVIGGGLERILDATEWLMAAFDDWASLVTATIASRLSLRTAGDTQTFLVRLPFLAVQPWFPRRHG